jgi:hypothetical protein
MKTFDRIKIKLVQTVAVILLCGVAVSCRTTTYPESSSFTPIAFNDPGNASECYGRCPKCDAWVTGGFAHLCGEDMQGNGVSWGEWAGKCHSCNSNLYSDEDLVKVSSNKRIVHWKIEINTPIETYLVQKGDTVTGIARKHGVSPKEMTKLNQLNNPDYIKVGQVLVLPQKTTE